VTAPPVTVIVNEGSGSGAPPEADLDGALSRAGLDATVERVRGDEVRAAAERAVHRRRAIVAAGGDGTVSTAAAVAIEHGATFGVIPTGTLNHFARDAGIPLDIEAAVATIAAGHTRLLDAGSVNGRTFVNNVSLGFYPRIVRERELERQRGHGKWPAFGIAIARTWLRYQTVTAHLTVDGAALVRRTPFVFIGNGAYKPEGLDVGQRVSMDGGRLWIYLTPECGRFEMLALSVRALAGMLGSDVKLEVLSTTEMTIETSRRHARLAIDGELATAHTPLRCAIHPGALRTLVPQGG